MLLLITHGFEKSEQVAKEISLAIDEEKSFMLLRYRTLEPDIIINLKTKRLNLGNYNQTSFDTKEELVRNVLSNIKVEKTKPLYTFSIGEQESENKEVEASHFIEQKTLKQEILLDNTDISRLYISNDFLNTIYKEAHHLAINRYKDAKLSNFAVQVFPFRIAGSKVTIYMRFFSKRIDKVCTYRYSDDTPVINYAPPDRQPEPKSQREIFKRLPWNKNPKWDQFLRFVYAKEGPFASAIGTCYHLFADPLDRKQLIWRVILDDNFRGKTYRYSWNGKKMDEHNILAF